MLGIIPHRSKRIISYNNSLSLSHDISYCLAPRPSDSLPLLSYERQLFPLNCLMSLLLNLHLLQKLLCIFHPINLSSTLLLLSCLLQNIFLTFLPWSVHSTYPVHSNLDIIFHSNLFFSISATMYRSLCSSLHSWSVHILHIPYSTTGPCILNTFLCHVSSPFLSITVIAHVSLPNTTAGFTNVFVS